MSQCGYDQYGYGNGASFELMDMFCYVGDMLSVDGDADAAVEARVR